MKAIALDDEPLALEIIRAFCERSGQIQLEKTFVKPSEALKHIRKFPVDVLFLDIRMPSISGVDFAQQIPSHIQVIFTTAYSEYAVEGFNLKAADYLLKPFSYERFLQAVEKTKELQKLTLTQTPAVEQTLFIRADYSLIPIAVSAIQFIEGLDDYVKINIDDRSPVVARMTMKGILEKLPPTQFVRVHRSFIVPLSRVTSVRNKTLLVSGRELPVGASYEQELKTFLTA